MEMTNAIRFHDRALERLSRRELLKIAWWLGAAAVSPSIVTTRALAQPRFDAYPFPLGVASGDPTPDGIVLRTRLAPHPLDGGGMPMANVDVDWELANDAAFRSIVQKGTFTARPEVAHSVHIDVTGLQPSHDYFYRFRIGDEISQAGRTRTAPPAGADVDQIR